MKTLKQVQDLIRSQFINRESIRVVYLGRISNFKYGIVQEAVARYATKSTEFDYPYPQYLHCEFNIVDSDGDSFTVSRDGIEFKKDFYPLPDNFEVGADLFERNLEDELGEFERRTRKILEELETDPEKNADSIELCHRVLSSRLPF